MDKKLFSSGGNDPNGMITLDSSMYIDKFNE